jgi:alpha-glucosidase
MIGKAALLGCAMMTAAMAVPARATPIASTAAALTPRSDGIEVRRGAVLLRVDALTDAIVRVRIGRDGKLPEDASWAVPHAVREASV